MNHASHRPLSAITVAAMIWHDQRFLMVEEQIDGHVRLNQPAGHVEPGETLLEAVVREVREETRYTFHPKTLLGIYHSNPSEGPRILRVAICGMVEPDCAPLDPDILTAGFFSTDEIRARRADLRSPFVQRCIDDFLNGQRFPLAVLNTLTE
jgi:phosphatase NudJ